MADKSTTITKLEVTHNPVPHGQGFSVSAHVTPAGPNRVHGDVEFSCDGAQLGIARTDSTGVAAIGVPGGLIHAGAHEFGAVFHGDGYNAESTAEVLSVVLAPADGEVWPADDKVEKFKGSASVAKDGVVEPVMVRELVGSLPPDPAAPTLVGLEPNRTGIANSDVNVHPNAPVAPLSPMEPLIQPTRQDPQPAV